MTMSLSIVLFLFSLSAPFLLADQHQDIKVAFNCLRQEMMSEIETLRQELIQERNQRLNVTNYLTKQIEEEKNERIKLTEQLNQCVRGNDTNDAMNTTTSSTTVMTTATSTPTAHFCDCADVYKSGLTTTGAYKIYPVDLNNVELEVTAYCDMSNGGGWTVFQRRLDGTVPFNRTWTEYRDGFGDVNGELWLGNKYLAAMTNSPTTNYRLRIDLTDFEDQTRFAQYSDFRIAQESENFRLSIGTYSGTLGNAGTGGLTYHNGQDFSTYDRDNDQYSGSCSSYQGGYGGFWYNVCIGANLNGQYFHSVVYNNGIVWNAWQGWHSLKSSVMMLRPMDFN